MIITKLHATLALVALGAWSALAAANFPVGTHVIKGSVMGYDEYGRNVLLKPDSEVVIRAANTNGQVIAETRVVEATADGINFVLRIPLSTTATDSTCAVGDKLNCVMSQASGTLISTEPVTVGGALESQTVMLKLIDVRRYVSQDGTVTNEVAQTYVDGIEWWMEDEEEYSGKSYDPFADYDGDGASNYAEYIAGTNPFDPSDCLRVRAFSFEPGMAEISFEYVGGHVYGVTTTTDLTNPAWMQQKVRTSKSGDEYSQIAPSADPADVGDIIKIYMTPATESPQRFFKLEAK